jgi:peptide/nickel transport system substrate-binding protein
MILVTNRRLRRATFLMTVGAILALVTACSSSASPRGTATGTKIEGGTATMALQASDIPNYIFPLMSGSQWTPTNFLFQQMMYRPLYWFGENGQPVLTPGLSLANTPTWSNDDKTVTITLKDYMWSDGQRVTADDVALWENMLKTAGTNYAMSIPGPTFYPNNIVATDVVNSSTIVFTLNRSYNPTWFLYNELAQITPLPAAWDVTSVSAPAGSGGCATDLSKCQAVYNFIETQSKDINAYATNPLWQVVDGPWKLAHYQNTGFSVFIPNRSYSGPVKPSLAKFELLPFTSQAAEFGDLISGHSIDVGYLPVSDAPEKSRLTSSGYTIVPWPLWGQGFMPDNETSPTDGPMSRQLYVRQALQYVMDQPTIISKAYSGYAYPDYGPVPISPPNPFVSASEERNPYPFSISKASHLLTSHGWTIESGTATCTSPGSGTSQCGSGIAAGTKMVFQLIYVSGATEVQTAMEIYKSDASRAGITINLQQEPFGSIISTIFTPHTKWDIAQLGIGGVMAPSYYPSGEGGFITGAAANNSDYSNAVNDANIRATNYGPASDTQSALDTYQDYLAVQVPVIWDPQPLTQISAVADTLKGVAPQDPCGDINPENWYFVKS